LFWLDGHYSSDFEVNGEWIKTARTDKDTPVANELRLILNDEIEHVILIDDARLFTGKNDYPTINNVKQMVASHKENYLVDVEEDIIRIVKVNHFPKI